MNRSATTVLWSVASAFLVVAGLWLALMEILLRHPGFAPQAVIALLITAHGLLSVLASRNPGNLLLRRIVALGGAAAVLFGAFAIAADLRARSFEGYILLIGAGLIVQGLLSLVATFGPPRLRAASPPIPSR